MVFHTYIHVTFVILLFLISRPIFCFQPFPVTSGWDNSNFKVVNSNFKEHNKHNTGYMHGAYQSACRATLEFLKIFEKMEETKISEKSHNEKKWKILKNFRRLNWNGTQLKNFLKLII